MEQPLIYQFYLALVDSEPPIWRCFHIPATFNLVDLHQVIKIVMGWSADELYEFRLEEHRFQSHPQASQQSRQDMAQIALINLAMEPEQSMLYTYAPAAGWLHKLALDSTFTADSVPLSPRCLAGERACPPVFCEGVWGYEELQDRLNDLDDPEFHELWEQVGPDFDPERFDLESVNRQLDQWMVSRRPSDTAPVARIDGQPSPGF